MTCYLLSLLLPRSLHLKSCPLSFPVIHLVPPLLNLSRSPLLMLPLVYISNLTRHAINFVCSPFNLALQLPASRLRFVCILSINDIDIRTQTDINQALATLRDAGASVCNIRFTFDEVRNSLSASGLPQLYFDQLRDVRKILCSLREPPESATVHHLTRPGLKKQPDWSEW
jgi:hypothetical protein